MGFRAVVCLLVWHISQVIGWEDYILYSRKIFRVEGFPYETRLKLSIATFYRVYFRHITLSTFFLINFRRMSKR